MPAWGQADQAWGAKVPRTRSRGLELWFSRGLGRPAGPAPGLQWQPACCREPAIGKRAALLAAAVAACGLTLAPGRARADKRVVVLDFGGGRSADVQESVAALVDSRHHVVSAATYQRAARRLKLRKMTDRNVARVAARLEADGVLSGALMRQGGRYRLELVLRAGRSGRVVKRISVPMRQPRITRRERSVLQAKLLPALRHLPALFDEPAGDDGNDSDDGDDGVERVEPRSRRVRARTAEPAEEPAEAPAADSGDDEDPLRGDRRGRDDGDRARDDDGDRARDDDRDRDRDRDRGRDRRRRSATTAPGSRTPPPWPTGARAARAWSSPPALASWAAT